jgi:hypothetical protein
MERSNTMDKYGKMVDYVLEECTDKYCEIWADPGLGLRFQEIPGVAFLINPMYSPTKYEITFDPRYDPKSVVNSIIKVAENKKENN